MTLAGRGLTAPAPTCVSAASHPTTHAPPGIRVGLAPLPRAQDAGQARRTRVIPGARSRSRPSWSGSPGIGGGGAAAEPAAADASAAAVVAVTTEPPPPPPPAASPSDTAPRRHRKRGGQEGRPGVSGGGGAGRRRASDEDDDDGQGALPADVRAALAALAEASPATLAAALADSLEAPLPSEWADPAARPGAEDVLTQAMLDEDPPGHRSGYVAIVGRPNAGKSTLLNCLTGAKLAAVSPKAQTTRHRVLGIASTETCQMVLLDTPGLLPDRRPIGKDGRPVSSASHASSSSANAASTGPSAALDARMMATVKRATADADAILALVDAGSPTAGAAIAELTGRLVAAAKPAAILLNKVDRLPGGGGLESPAVQAAVAAAATASGGLPVFPICAVDGRGVSAAAGWAAEQLPEGPSLYPRHLLSSAPTRFFVAEIVREKIMALYRDEVPYASTVTVTEYTEREPPAKDYIAVTIAVERPRQRAILLGAGGSALKRLGAAARADVELFLGRPVYLDVSVKVAPGWRRSAAELEAWGY